MSEDQTRCSCGWVSDGSLPEPERISQMLEHMESHWREGVTIRFVPPDGDG